MNKLLTYCKMVLLFCILGSIVLSIGGIPFLKYVTSYGSMIIVKGAPGNTYYGELVEPIVNNDVTEEQSIIKIPAKNTQYGTVLCDRIDLIAPLYYGDNSYSLQNGAGQYAESGLPGEGRPILIGGHDGTFFSPLKSIQIGDVITINTTYGEYEYKVTATKIADREDVTAFDLNQNKEQLILYTCYPFGQLIGDRNKRFFVYGDPIIDISEAKLPEEQK